MEEPSEREQSPMRFDQSHPFIQRKRQTPSNIQSDMDVVCVEEEDGNVGTDDDDVDDEDNTSRLHRIEHENKRYLWPISLKSQPNVHSHTYTRTHKQIRIGTDTNTHRRTFKGLPNRRANGGCEK